MKRCLGGSFGASVASGDGACLGGAPFSATFFFFKISCFSRLKLGAEDGRSSSDCSTTKRAASSLAHGLSSSTGAFALAADKSFCISSITDCFVSEGLEVDPSSWACNSPPRPRPLMRGAAALILRGDGCSCGGGAGGGGRGPNPNNPPPPSPPPPLTRGGAAPNLGGDADAADCGGSGGTGGGGGGNDSNSPPPLTGGAAAPSLGGNADAADCSGGGGAGGGGAEDNPNSPAFPAEGAAEPNNPVCGGWPKLKAFDTEEDPNGPELGAAAFASACAD